MVTIEWNYVCTITRPLLKQRKCLIDLNSHSSPLASGSWGRLVFVALLNSSMHYCKATAGPQGTLLFTSNPTQKAPSVHPQPFFSLSPHFSVTSFPCPNPLAYLSSHLFPLCCSRRWLWKWSEHLSSEWGVLGIGMEHSVLEVMGSFHSKHWIMEGLKCGFVVGERRMFHYFSIT